MCISIFIQVKLKISDTYMHFLCEFIFLQGNVTFFTYLTYTSPKLRISNPYRATLHVSHVHIHILCKLIFIQGNVTHFIFSTCFTYTYTYPVHIYIHTGQRFLSYIHVHELYVNLYLYRAMLHISHVLDVLHIHTRFPCKSMFV